MKIKKYLQTNRLSLDADNPDNEKIWGEIQKGLNPSRSIQNNWFWKVAAVFLLGVLITYVAMNERKTDRVVIVTLAGVSEELGQHEAELKQIVDKKWAEIQPLSASEKSQFQFLFDELTELDKVYKTYESDLYTTGENDQIINVLLDYYEKKINILNRLSLEIQKQKSHENNVTL